MNVHNARTITPASKSADTVPVEISLEALANVNIQLARIREQEARELRKAAKVLLRDRSRFHVEVPADV